jgi:hypothetical protein
MTRSHRRIDRPPVMGGGAGRTESLGAHQRRGHPSLAPELPVSLPRRLNANGQLTTAALSGPPISH